MSLLAVGEVKEVAEFDGPLMLFRDRSSWGRDLSECCRSSIPVVSRANSWCRFSEGPGGKSQY